MINSKGLQRFLRNRTALLSLIFITLVILASTSAPLLTSFSYDQQNVSERLSSPSLRHIMGTDFLGRDVWSRILYGGRVSLTVGVVTALSTLIFGTLSGALAGYFGGWIEKLVMGITHIFFILPSLLIAILLTLLFGKGLVGLLIALSATSWVTQARLVRAQVLQAKQLPYVESARSCGATPLTIVFRHILPNLWGPILVSLTIQIPTQVMSESFLSFIGL
ncbi:ABC transporter permease, partial [bacterium]|nr:ABC transporter permease [bacterium]